MATSSNIKYTARIPIIPNDVTNKAEHKDKELLMDFSNDDIYIHRNGKYINITGEIKEIVENIKDGTSVIHIVTEDSLPAVKDREKNHWYWVVTDAKDYGSGQNLDTTSYIYYGVINDEYYQDNTYLLIAQNMLTNPSAVKINAPEGYKACFYVPTEYEPQFFNDETGEIIPFTVQDRLYCLTPDNVSVAYDVYISDDDNLGSIYINMTYTGADWYTIKFGANYSNIEGFELSETERKIADGEVLGKIKDPSWTENRYIFYGWSKNKLEFDPIDPETYIPEDNETIYAYFEYDNDMSKYTFKCIYRSSVTGDTIGTWYSVALPGTEIYGKSIDGFITPGLGVELASEGQNMTFDYTPIEYNISYDLDGGTLTSYETKYTAEDEYTPNIPVKDGYTFQRWNPRNIEKGTIGDITFTAYWKINGVLHTADTLRSLILDLYPNIENYATAIERTNVEPDSDTATNVSSTSTPIYMWYDKTTTKIMYYCDTDITCSDDMSGVFEGFISLTNIDGISDWIIDPTADISSIFKNCTTLVDLSAINGWNMTGRNFSDAFTGTAAYLSGRLPDWYVFSISIKYIDANTLNTITTENANVIPNKTFTCPIDTSIMDKYDTYNFVTTELIATKNNQTFTVTCALK